MIKHELARESIPEQRNRSLARPLGRVILAFVFSAAQAWALIVLAGIALFGVELFALVLVLSAAFIAVLDAWREIRSCAAVRRSSEDCGGELDSRAGK
ncbi:hypothetical protein [Saccharopolyspora pogona]|uniref:hypothetical protein n=1 Tax=Saccharopolyspora pogona TaxID=333966 RepID=UPI0016857B8C|nr:hypothetical protein [Saccharopolyspora pogona]